MAWKTISPGSYEGECPIFLRKCHRTSQGGRDLFIFSRDDGGEYFRFGISRTAMPKVNELSRNELDGLKKTIKKMWDRSGKGDNDPLPIVILGPESVPHVELIA